MSSLVRARSSGQQTGNRSCCRALLWPRQRVHDGATPGGSGRDNDKDKDRESYLLSVRHHCLFEEWGAARTSR